VAADATEVDRRQRRALLHGIYVIINAGPHVLELARAALDAGVRIVQYRAKGSIDASDLERLRRDTFARDALLILNDDWRAARAFECDGVHLGPDDDGFTQIATVREQLPNGLIGLSCGTLEEVRYAKDADVDYLGIGSVYATGSKTDAGAPIGTASLQTLVRAAGVPVAAIGGITVATIPEIRRSGAAMAAVISAVSAALDPRRAARELVAAWTLGTSAQSAAPIAARDFGADRGAPEGA
jgi:thiamine-phosphate pyrophosphorylase